MSNKNSGSNNNSEYVDREARPDKPVPHGSGKIGRGGKATSHKKRAQEVHHHYYYDAPPVKPGRSSKPSIAGALLIITAVLGLIGGSMFFVGGYFFSSFDEDFDFFAQNDKGDIVGRVTFVNQTGVEGATVTIIGTNFKTTTDSDGYYIIYNAPTGNQEIKVEFEGYNTYIRKADIKPKEVNEWTDDGPLGGNEYNFQITEGDDVIERGKFTPWNAIKNIMYICAVLIILFSVFSLIGGIYALKRQKFGMALLGAIFGLFTVVGSVFALIALFILIISRNEFKSGGE